MSSTTNRKLSQGTSTLAIGCLSLFSSVFPVVAHAATDATDPPANLGGVTVTDTAIDEGSYKTDRVSSPKGTAPLLDTPKSITVISRQVLEDTNSTTLADALRTVPGITLGSGEGGSPLGDRPFIRGSDAAASTYLDGVRDIAAQARETFDVDAIEVTKGSDSVTYGSGNGGGSINIVSKVPTTKRFVKVDGSLGNADYKRVTVDINQPINDFVGVRINAMYHDQGIAGRDAVWQKRWGIAPSIKFGMNGPTSLEFDWYHMHSTELPDSGIPYYTVAANQKAVTGSNFVQTAPVGTNLRSRDAFYGLSDRDFRTTNTDDLTARFEHTTDGGIKLRNTARYSNTTQEYFYVLPDNSVGNVATYGTVSRRANDRYSYETGYVDQADASGTFKTGPLSHSFAAAVEYNWQKSGYGSFYSDASGTALSNAAGVSCPTTPGTDYNCTSLANPNPNDPYVGSIARGPANSMTLARSSTTSASLFDTISIGDKWKLNLGGRYDHYVTNASAALAAPFVGTRTWQQVTNDLFTYQAGLMYKPVSNGTFYVSTGTSAVPPGSFLAQGNEDNAVAVAQTAATQIDPNSLKVARTTSYEVGTKWNLLHDQLALTFDLFQTRTTNARTTDPTTNLPVYIGTKRVRGIEFGFSGNITPNWNVFGGYAYMPSRITDAGTTATVGTNAAGAAATVYNAAATVGMPFPNTPKNSATLFTNYKVTPKFTLGGGAIYMGKVYGGFSDTRTYVLGVYTVTGTRATYVPDYWRFDANASYKVNSFLNLRISALNITNKLYYDEAYATHYAQQAAGRTVIGTVSIKY
jgi:catecholate siderophore receptor